MGIPVVIAKKNARCVKCAGEHLTADCKVPRNVKAKCYNCGGQHPASYRGCDVENTSRKIAPATTRAATYAEILKPVKEKPITNQKTVEKGAIKKN